MNEQTDISDFFKEDNTTEPQDNNQSEPTVNNNQDNKVDSNINDNTNNNNNVADIDTNDNISDDTNTDTEDVIDISKLVESLSNDKVKQRLSSIQSIEDFEKLFEQKETPKDPRIELYEKFINEGGNPQDYFKAEKDIETYENYSLDSDENKKQIVLEYLKDNNYKEKDINVLLQLYDKNDELEDQAKEALTYFKNKSKQSFDELRKKQEEQQLSLKQEFEQYKDNVKHVLDKNEILPIKLNDAQKNKVYESMTTIVTDENGNSQLKYIQDLQKIENINYKLSVMNALGLFDNDGFERLLKDVGTKQVRKAVNSKRLIVSSKQPKAIEPNKDNPSLQDFFR